MAHAQALSVCTFRYGALRNTSDLDSRNGTRNDGSDKMSDENWDEGEAISLGVDYVLASIFAAIISGSLW
jgi:hypothetical protein